VELVVATSTVRVSMLCSMDSVYLSLMNDRGEKCP
jgi:hypothetical protein